MKDLLIIIKTEQKSLIRGFVVVFFLALPFAFMPFIIKQGFSIHTISQSFLSASLYAGIVSLGLITVAMLNNYNRLSQKKRLYEFPVFKALNFSGAVEAYNSIVKELSTYLFGKVGQYYFRVNIVDPSKKPLQVELSPLVYIGSNTNLLQRLIQDLGLQEELYLSKILYLSEDNLQQNDLLLIEIEQLAGELASLGVKPLGVKDINFT